MKIGVVGPCAAGKTTLISVLREQGYDVRHIAQEHSYVADMWKKITKPDCLIYLDVSYENASIRRNMNWTFNEYAEQVYRLRHAREHANFYLNTDDLPIDQVLEKTSAFLEGLLQDE